MWCTNKRNLFIRNNGDGTGNGIVFFFCQMDDPLVGAAAEMKIWITERLDERAVHQGINIWKYLLETFISKDFLICKTGIAPYILAGLFLYAASQFRESLHLIERVSAGKGDIGELIGLYHFKYLIDRDFPTSLEIPGLGIVTAGTMMGASRTID